VVRRVEASHLMHLAWFVAPGRWASDPENLQWVGASIDLMRSFHANGGVRMVTSGSGLQYDWSYGYCSEERTPRNPHTLYGACKNAFEDVAAAFGRGHRLQSASARIFFVYGPHEHPDRLVASVIRSLLAGEPARCSHGRQIRDYLFADDVADALVALLESDFVGPVNVASGEAVTLRDIVARIGRLIGRPDLIRLGAIAAAPTDTPLVVADVSRLTNVVKWRPRFDLESGLTRTIEALRQPAATI
jgi:nucleoside-diphosphate-sugar epimerase